MKPDVATASREICCCKPHGLSVGADFDIYTCSVKMLAIQDNSMGNKGPFDVSANFYVSFYVRHLKRLNGMKFGLEFQLKCDKNKYAGRAGARTLEK